MAFNTEVQVTNKTGTTLDVELPTTTEVQVVNKTGTTLQVINGTGTTLDVEVSGTVNVLVTNPVITPTQAIYTDDTITEGVPQNITTSLDQTKNLIVHYIGVIGVSGGIFRLKLTSGIVGTTLFFQCYIGDAEVLNLNTETIFPAIGGGSLNQFYYEIERVSGAGVPVELTIVYSTAEPS